MNLELNKVYPIKVIDQENEGLGVSRINNIIVFVLNGLPGDEGEVKITEIKKNFARGKMVSFSTLSGDRATPPCPYFSECGGCDLQHQIYTKQLLFKEHKIETALKRIGGFTDIKISPIISDNPYNYRNKITLRVNGSKIGLYKHNSNEIIDIEKCLISNDKINEAIVVLRTFVESNPHNTFDTIMIRYIDGLMINVTSQDNSFNKELVSFLNKNLKDLKSLFINNNLLYGEKKVNTQIDNLSFNLSAQSFFQVNIDIMNKLYNQVLSYIAKSNNNTILDLYCGIGTMTLLMSKYAKKVIGIEVVEEAIDNANENLEINSITNVRFIQGNVEVVIDSLIDEKLDTIVLDPPRSGVEQPVIDAIIKIKPKQVIYVSCNPVTLARDLKIICGNEYIIKEITPFDMFPQTSHVECVARLCQKSFYHKGY